MLLRGLRFAVLILESVTVDNDSLIQPISDIFKDSIFVLLCVEEDCLLASF